MVEIRGLEADFAILIGHDNVPHPGRGKDAQPVSRRTILRLLSGSAALARFA
jgi:hypothetical protein